MSNANVTESWTENEQNLSSLLSNDDLSCYARCDGDVSGCRNGLCCHSPGAQSFDLAGQFRCRPDTAPEDGEVCDDYAVWSEFFDDRTSTTDSATSSMTVPPGYLDDRLATLSVSSTSSYSLYDPDDDGYSISTLENLDADEDLGNSELELTVPVPDCSPPFPPPLICSARAAIEDLEFNFLSSSSATNVRRSASLKSSYGSTPPRSPRVKKAVRFADALGLDLESIRHILDAGDAPPTSLIGGSTSARRVGTKTRLTARFAEPGAAVNFLRRVQERKVSLEEISLDPERLSVSGIIRVANIAYQKLVTVRYSVDNWQTYSDHAAVYLPPGSANTRYDGGLTDAFTFQLVLPPSMSTGGCLEFSVRFVAGRDLTFWDSNFGTNYVIDCGSTDKP